MKPEHLKLIAILFLATPAALVASEYDMTFVNEKVAPLAAKLSAIPKHLRMVDDTTDTLATPEFQALRTKCTTDWQQIATNIDKVQGGDEAKKLVIFAFENLTPQDYMSALETIVTQYEGGKISDGSIQGLLHPKGRMCDFLVDNHAHSRVAALLNRIKAKTKDAAVKKDITEKLDGTDKASLDGYRSDYEGTSEAGPPPVILPP